MSNLDVLQSSDNATIWTEPPAHGQAPVTTSEEAEAG